MNTYLTVAKINYHRTRAATELHVSSERESQSCGAMCLAEYHCREYQKILNDLLTMLELR